MSRWCSEEAVWHLPGGPLRLLGVRNLDSRIDCKALLGDEEVPEPPYWAHLWPAAISLARLLGDAGPALKGRQVIELGCGLGLPGLVAARSGAKVLFTDRSLDALGFAFGSARRNGLPGWFACVDWMKPAIRGRFDLCLAADVTYDPNANGRFVEFLNCHLADDGEVWVAESVRAEEPGLPELLRKCFDLSQEYVPEIEDGHRVWVRVLRGRRAT